MASMPDDSRMAERDARIARLAWGGSSAGRASRSQCEGRGFDPLPLHQFFIVRRCLLMSAGVGRVLPDPGSTARQARIGARHLPLMSKVPEVASNPLWGHIWAQLALEQTCRETP